MKSLTKRSLKWKSLGLNEGLEPTARVELATLGLRIWQHSGNSLILRHGWRPKSTQNHVRNAQVVPILYSFDRLRKEQQTVGRPLCARRRRKLNHMRVGKTLYFRELAGRSPVAYRR